MTVKFSGAHIDERGKASGGRAGDQTGKEICTRDAYTYSKVNPWRVFRYPDSKIAEVIGSNAKKIADNNCYGYDQNQRTTGYNAAKKLGWDVDAVKTPVELDCSEMVRLCVASALKKDISDFNTVSEATVLLRLGFKEVKGWSLNSLQKGDILVTTKKGHTEIVSKGVEVTNKSVEKNEKKTDEEVAREVLAGKWGSGSERRSKLTAAGYDYEKIQSLVNALSGGGAPKLYYYPKYSGSSTSIVTALKAVKVDSSMANRKKIATANKIKDYSGTAAQNTQLLALLKQGKLIKAE